MPNPKSKHSRSRRDSRRAQNWKLVTPSLSTCPNCGKLRTPHQVCASCGYYKDRVVMAVKSAEDKKSTDDKNGK